MENNVIKLGSPLFEGIDLFAGAGGVTTGIERAAHEGRPVARVIAAINHDPLALASHEANHAQVIHFTEDIRNFDVNRLPQFEDRGNKLVFIWASLECTNFSNAKGGLPRDPDSRTLANHLFRYIEHVDPDYVFIENVREFMAWGPLNEDGKPVSRRSGADYLRWINHICDYGYEYDWRLLNAADFGAHTSRIRYFGIFARKGLPIVFPVSTHLKKPYDGIKPWKAVREVLDLQDEGNSIFERKKPLVERTLRRILAGLEKYVGNEKDCFILKYLGNNSATGVNKGANVDDPSPTITTQNRLALAKIDFLQNYYSGGGQHRDINRPAGTVTTKDRTGKVTVQYIDKQYNGPENHQSLDRPCGTITANPKLAFISTRFLDKRYNGSHNHQSIERPAGTLTTTPKMALISADQFIMPTGFDNEPRDLNQPLNTITANRKWHYLVNPQYGNPSWNLDKPCFTLIARMDKKPPYMVTADEVIAPVMILNSTRPEGKKHVHITEKGTIVYRFFDTDSAEMIKIKIFMLTHGIVDIKMRMLRIDELKKITGLPEDYILLGNQGEQKKFVGNAVPPVIPQKIFETLYHANRGIRENSHQEGLPLFKHCQQG